MNKINKIILMLAFLAGFINAADSIEVKGLGDGSVLVNIYSNNENLYIEDFIINDENCIYVNVGTNARLIKDNTAENRKDKESAEKFSPSDKNKFLQRLMLSKTIMNSNKCQKINKLEFITNKGILVFTDDGEKSLGNFSSSQTKSTSKQNNEKVVHGDDLEERDDGLIYEFDAHQPFTGKALLYNGETLEMELNFKNGKLIR